MPERLNHYDLDAIWQPQATFLVGSTPTDPTTLTVKQQAPDLTETVLAAAVSPAALNASSTPVAKVSTGVFKLNPGITMSQVGDWYVKFIGTGTAAAADTHQAVVDPDPFLAESGIGSRALVSLGEVKDWLQGQQVAFGEDRELVRVINDISDRAHDEAKREFKVDGTNPAARVFPVDARMLRQRIVDVGDLATAPTLVEVLDTDGTTVLGTETNYLVDPPVRGSDEPIRRLILTSGFYALRPGMRVRVTGTWGFPAVPGNVRQAVLDAIVAVMDRDVEHYRQDLGYATVAGGGGGGQPTTVIVGGPGNRQRFLSMPPSSLAVIWDYRDLYIG